MKPLMLIPPAQAEALYDAQEEAQVDNRFASLPWLDDDASEEEPAAKVPPRGNNHHGQPRLHRTRVPSGNTPR